MRRTGFGILIAAALAALFFVLASGCVQPGRDVSKGLTQESRVGWTADGNFSQWAIGTHTNNVLMVEGEIVLREDGTIDYEQSTITALLRTSPSAKDAGSAMQAAFVAQTEQAKMFAEMFTASLSLITPFVGRPPSGPARPTPVEPP
jgi:hypothetical protein